MLILTVGIAMPFQYAVAASGMSKQESMQLFERARTGNADAIEKLRSAAERGSAEAQDAYAGYLSFANGQLSSGQNPDSSAAVIWFKKSADQAYAQGQRDLAFLYMRGIGVKQDVKEALRLYRLAGEQGDAGAALTLGQVYLSGDGTEKNLSAAGYWMSKAAESGDAFAQYKLTWMVANGQGLEKNDSEAQKWLRLAAFGGNTDAQISLSSAYAQGYGVSADPVMAYRWSEKALTGMISQGADYSKLKKTLEDLSRVMTPQQIAAARMHGMAPSFKDAAPPDLGSHLQQIDIRVRALKGEHEARELLSRDAKAGDAAAAFWLYKTLERHPDTRQDAIVWLKKAAELGYPSAEMELGSRYGDGDGVSLDRDVEISWYRKAAEQGEPIAQVSLAAFLFAGEGIEKDPKLGMQWLTKAAMSGEAVAQHVLGTMYAGKGVVPKNDQLSIKWLTLAAEQGNAEALYSLSGAYHEGKRVAKNEDKARQFLEMAAYRGNPHAQLAIAGLAMMAEPSNSISAYKWASLASVGFAKRSETDDLVEKVIAHTASQMSPTQFKLARTLVEEFKLIP